MNENTAAPVDKNSRPSWGEAFRVYSKPRVITMLFLGFSAGLPFLMVFSTLTAYLTEAGLSRTTIGFFGWVGITYSIKVFWAPVVDRVDLPLLTRLLGRRRSWMILAQIGIALSLAAMALVNPVQGLTQFAICAVVVAFCSATQDITIDAYRIEAAGKSLQGAMSASYILGYRLALLVAGAGSLFIAEYTDWQTVYFVMAAFMSVGFITVLVIPKLDRKVAADDVQREARVIDFLERFAHLPAIVRTPGAWFIGAVICPFADFFGRNGFMAIVILLFIGIYRISDITMGIMANPFYLDLGFSKPEIASVTKFFGFFMTIAGAAFGGVMVVRVGIMRPLLLGAVLVAATNLLFALMAEVGPSLTLLAVVVSADNLSGGIATAAFIAYLSSLTSTAYTATQYALFSSLMTLPAKIFSGFSGIIVDTQGYFFFFTYASLVGIPAILMVLYLMRVEKTSLRS